MRIHVDGRYHIFKRFKVSEMACGDRGLSSLAGNGFKRNELVQSLNFVGKSSFSEEESRAQAARAARSLFLRLESPYERFQRPGYLEVSTGVAKPAPRSIVLIPVNSLR